MDSLRKKGHPARWVDAEFLTTEDTEITETKKRRKFLLDKESIPLLPNLICFSLLLLRALCVLCGSIFR
jgi:hypothetical protein